MSGLRTKGSSEVRCFYAVIVVLRDVLERTPKRMLSTAAVAAEGAANGPILWHDNVTTCPIMSQ